MAEVIGVPAWFLIFAWQPASAHAVLPVNVICGALLPGLPTWQAAQSVRDGRSMPVWQLTQLVPKPAWPEGALAMVPLWQVAHWASGMAVAVPWWNVCGSVWHLVHVPCAW